MIKGNQHCSIYSSPWPLNVSFSHLRMLVNMGDLPQPEQDVLSQMVWSPLERAAAAAVAASSNSTKLNTSSSGGKESLSFLFDFDALASFLFLIMPYLRIFISYARPQQLLVNTPATAAAASPLQVLARGPSPCRPCSSSRPPGPLHPTTSTPSPCLRCCCRLPSTVAVAVVVTIAAAGRTVISATARRRRRRRTGPAND